MTYDVTGKAGSSSSGGDQSTTEQVKERASDMAGQAQEKVRGAVESQVDERSDQAADRVEQVADDVRAVSESLNERGQDAAARIVEQGADYAQQLSDYLRRSSSDQLLEDVAAFARRQPWAVAVGGLVLGFAASRVLRASAAGMSGDGIGSARAYSGSTERSGVAGASAYGPGPTATSIPATGTAAMPNPVTNPVTSPATGPMTSANPEPLDDPMAGDGRVSPGSRTTGGW